MTDDMNPIVPPDAAAWVSISHYARTYGLTRHTVYKLLDAHLLEVYRLAGVVAVVRIRNLPPDQHQAGQQAS